jgi:hypothetical protein
LAPAFAGLTPEHVGLAVPILVGGDAVAVVYADDMTDSNPPVPASWPEAIEILGRHAAARLETLTARRTAQALGIPIPSGKPAGAGSSRGAAAPAGAEDESARRYARLLVSEIKLYNEGAVRVGRQKRDLLERLRFEIDRARRLYDERVSSGVRARAYFEEELVQTLADGDPALLGPAVV